jgi:hypothetical protein
MRKSLINRKAAKAADSMWRRKGMFARVESPVFLPPRSLARDRETRQKAVLPVLTAEKSAAPRKVCGNCPGFIPEEDNPYPLCDNPACPQRDACNLSAHMLGPHDEM